jgi:hypothetical protein
MSWENVMGQWPCGSYIQPLHGRQPYWGYGGDIMWHCYGKSPSLIGKTTINGPFSIAMLNYQRVSATTLFLGVSGNGGAKAPQVMLSLNRRRWMDDSPRDGMGLYFQTQRRPVRCEKSRWSLFASVKWPDIGG